MEKYRPSINDLITTTAGGIVYGEIGYRFSALVRKRGARGLERIWRETVGAVLDPVGGVNRLLNGRKDSDPGLPGSPTPAASSTASSSLTGPVVTRSARRSRAPGPRPSLGFTLALRRSGRDGLVRASLRRVHGRGPAPLGARPAAPVAVHPRRPRSESRSPGAAARPISSASTSTTNTTASTRCASAARRSPAGWTSRFELGRERPADGRRPGWAGSGSAAPTTFADRSRAPSGASTTTSRRASPRPST